MTELGNRLKEAREAKGLSLEDLQELTKIQKRYLIGIEEGNYSMMPGKFYVRAFIKQYCEAVGLDPEEIFEQYKNEIPSVYSEELPEQLSRVQSRKTIPAGDSKVVEMLPRILAVVLVIGAAVLIWVLVSNYMSNPDNDDKKNAKENEAVGYNKSDGFNEEKENADKKQDEEKSESSDEKNEDDAVVKDEKKEQNLAVTSSSGKNSTYELKNTDTFKLKVTSKGSPWVGIKNGEGKLLFQGTIEKDKSQEIDFTNEKEAVINIGRAYETEIYVNDEKLEYSISPTEVNTQLVTIQFTKAE
ncbi:helix-turn-helix domain-containing protein [Peribacillus simplex]|uniref:XRE family transcriptional regulator n=1 Tax=Peribacillus simplex TaxID=1478 RepID=A0AAN2TS63_9BACI|nr:MULTISPECIES: RodZ family helix-turn-helix domain-containing protein [Bacillaceae]MBD8589050.1 helix-turn-helix domain-containing protein [Peribacillus simplex]MCP1093117.1 helix-turn-helix domain-containing protein [Bacillaceae bacterium OS4b]MCF7621825.1 helix-turn-helix domain-containing protein [Peribacillus frigoritolerans]MCP1152483.1 helix-turn-helix domain-containing protein [Peribacillus frigoritolerans]MCT1387244.1 helix-turn-helix domain-containing protein [Peribacillus frigorito